MADMGLIGKASVEIGLDMSKLDKDDSILAERMNRRLADAEKRVKEKADKIRKAMKALADSADPDPNFLAKYKAMDQALDIQLRKQKLLEAAARKTAEALRPPPMPPVPPKPKPPPGTRPGDTNDSRSNGAYRLQQIGQTIDDLQYVSEQGLRPILNNIMQISPAIGIGLIAVDQLIKHFGLLDAAVEEPKDKVEALAAKLKKLEDRPNKISLDLNEIDRAKAKLAEIEERLQAFEGSKKGTVQGVMADKAKDVVGNAGGSPALMKAIAEMEMPNAAAHTDQANLDAMKDSEKAIASRKARIAAIDKGPYSLDAHQEKMQAQQDIKNLEATMAIAKAQVERDLQAWAKEEVGGFILGVDDKVQAMKNRALKNPGGFAQVGPGGVTAAQAIARIPSAEDAAKDLHREEMKKQGELQGKIIDEMTGEWGAAHAARGGLGGGPGQSNEEFAKEQADRTKMDIAAADKKARFIPGPRGIYDTVLKKIVPLSQAIEGGYDPGKAKAAAGHAAVGAPAGVGTGGGGLAGARRFGVMSVDSYDRMLMDAGLNTADQKKANPLEAGISSASSAKGDAANQWRNSAKRRRLALDAAKLGLQNPGGIEDQEEATRKAKIDAGTKSAVDSAVAGALGGVTGGNPADKLVEQGLEHNRLLQKAVELLGKPETGVFGAP